MIVVALVIAMLSNVGWRTRSVIRDFQEEVQATDRYIDIGATLTVVRFDPNGEALIPDAPRMRKVQPKFTKEARYRFGGIIDTKAEKPYRYAESRNPVHWFCSEQQEPVILHRDSEPRGQLVEGGMGAGKTTAGVIWTYLRWLEHLGEFREGGITAPTHTRLSVVFSEIFKMFPTSWYRYQSSTNILTLCDGTRIRGVSTYQQSESQGSALQGFNWSWWFGDELQDQIREFIHAQARLRSGKPGGAKRTATATAKDASDYRELRDTIEKSGKWSTRRLLGPDSPFVSDDHWESMRRTLSSRDYRRLVLAEDLPPELAVYYGWLRTRNLVARPQIVRDVTAAVLANYRSYIRPGAAFTLLAGHDPGVIYNTTEILKLLMFGDVPTWTVVGELQTKQTTAHEHAAALAKYVRETFGVEYQPTRHDPNPGGKLLTFIDPHGKGESQTDYQSVYMAFQKEGLDAFNPAPMTQRIKRTARVEMANRLLGGSADSNGVPRLVVATDEIGRPVAPRLVESFESLKKRPGDDDPEGSQAKNEDDKTHCPVAASYALWMFEQEAFTEQTIKTALLEARRNR